MMTDALRFGWLGESRRIPLHALLAREVSEWSRDWWLEHSSAAIDVYPLDEWLPVDSVVSTWRMGEGSFQLHAHQGEAALGAYLAATGSTDASALAERIGARALADLIARVAKRAAVRTHAAAANAAPAAACHRPELGAYMATLSLGSHTLAMAMDRTVVDLLVPPKKHEKTTLVGRAQAVGGASVALEVCIALGTSSLSQLDNLQVGEVLVGDALLTAPVELRAAGSGAVALAKLGVGQSSRIVTLTHSI
jgi:hypothetical protein